MIKTKAIPTTVPTLLSLGMFYTGTGSDYTDRSEHIDQSLLGQDCLLETAKLSYTQNLYISTLTRAKS